MHAEYVPPVPAHLFPHLEGRDLVASLYISSHKYCYSRQAFGDQYVITSDVCARLQAMFKPDNLKFGENTNVRVYPLPAWGAEQDTIDQAVTTVMDALRKGDGFTVEIRNYQHTIGVITTMSLHCPRLGPLYHKDIVMPVPGGALIFRSADVMRLLLDQPIPEGAIVYPLLVLCDY